LAKNLAMARLCTNLKPLTVSMGTWPKGVAENKTLNYKRIICDTKCYIHINMNNTQGVCFVKISDISFIIYLMPAFSYITR